MLKGNIRIFLSLPYDLVVKIERDVKTKPDTREGKIQKCIQVGYEHLTSNHPHMRFG